jgi:glycosyltransferase involved in cell wall biosynthesis
MFISVVVAVKNERRYIKKCIDALINQDYPTNKYEIIIVDGMSDDGTWEILEEIKKEIKKENPSIKIFRNPKENAAAGRNIGIKEAKGEFVAFIDSDAIAYPNWLKKIEETFGKVKEAIGVGGPDLLPPDSIYKSIAIGKIMASPLASGGKLNPSVQHIMSSKAAYVEHIPTCNLCLKKDVFEKVGYFDEDFVKGQDLELSERLKKGGYKLYHSPSIRVLHYRKRHIRQLAQQIYKWAKAKAAIIKKHGITNWAYLAPVGLFVASIALLLIFLFLDAMLIFAFLLFIGFMAYAFAISFESVRISVKDHDKRLFFYGMILFPIIHLSYTFGIFYGLIRKKIW